MTGSTETPAVAPATAEPTTVEKLRGLRWSILSNATNTVFSQFTFFGSPFVLLLSALGMSKPQIGLILSFLPFAGLIALFIAPTVARYGYKRVYITFWGLRKIITVGLLFLPWLAASLGETGMVFYVSAIMAGFALSRAIAETGFLPWVQEYIPNSVRGRYSATNSIYTTLSGLAAVGAAGFVLDRSNDLSAYILLIAAGIAFGGVSTWAATRIPGGAAVQRTPETPSLLGGMQAAMSDGNFMRYLAGASLVTLALVPMMSFLPLFMQEVVLLSAGSVVLLQAGVLVGHLVSSLAWGLAADRYGSKPVMIAGLVMKLLLPVMWFVMPRDTEISLYIALAIAVLVGISDMAWGIGAGRLLFVSVVPPHRKTEYMSFYYASIGVVGGISQLMGGWILEFSGGLSGQILGLAIDPYTPLFVMGLVLTLATLVILGSIRADNVFGVIQFAGMFLRGNPFQAMGAMIRYYQARDERTTISMTERLGRARSPLAVEELLETLRDPRFNVRFEAIIAIARMPADPRLTHALIEVFSGTELALQSVAAWAMGRIADPESRAALRAGLDSKYLSIRAHSARALGAMQDQSIADELLQRLPAEADRGLQMAYASALGNLRTEAALGPLLELLYATHNPGARLELALSVARILGDEHAFIQLLRAARGDLGTSASQAVSAFKRRLERAKQLSPEMAAALQDAANAFARLDVEGGTAGLSRVLALAAEPTELSTFSHATTTMMREGSLRLAEFGAEHFETVLLSLHALRTAEVIRT
ncbi:MAG: MFS transporter [Litorilinea sp.]